VKPFVPVETRAITEEKNCLEQPREEKEENALSPLVPKTPLLNTNLDCEEQHLRKLPSGMFIKTPPRSPIKTPPQSPRHSTKQTNMVSPTSQGISGNVTTHVPFVFQPVETLSTAKLKISVSKQSLSKKEVYDLGPTHMPNLDGFPSLEHKSKEKRATKTANPREEISPSQQYLCTRACLTFVGRFLDSKLINLISILLPNLQL